MTTPITTPEKYFARLTLGDLRVILRYQTYRFYMASMGDCALGCGKGSIGGRACAACIQAEIDRRTPAEGVGEGNNKRSES